MRRHGLLLRALAVLLAFSWIGFPGFGAIDRLDDQWPGLRDRLCEPGPSLRRHINVYVDRERAELGTAVASGSRIDVIAAISGG